MPRPRSRLEHNENAVNVVRHDGKGMHFRLSWVNSVTK
jgi:hypothetical protein